MDTEVDTLLYLSPINSRARFGELLNDLSLDGTAVEIGTHRGEFAEALLRTWKGERLYCVDPWDVPPGYEYQATTLNADRRLPDRNDRQRDLRACQHRLAEFGDQVIYLEMLSTAAAAILPDKSLDFVYIDGNHDYDYVCQDLFCWYPKLRSGGIMAAHDFICPGEVNGGWGRSVQPAIMEFCRRYALNLYLVPEPGYPWSCYFFKE